MNHSNARLPKPLPPKTVRYEKVLLNRMGLFGLFALFLFLCICSGSLFGFNRIQKAYQANRTLTAISKSTENMAMTQTAVPTQTPTLTPTITLTPTSTYTPTITHTPTITPVMAWSNSYSPDSGRSGAMLSLAVGDKDQIYLAYFEDTKDDLRMAKLLSGGWRVDRLTKTVNIGNQRSGWFPSVAIGTNGNTYISFFDYGAKSLNYIYSFSPGNWGSIDTIALGVNLLDNNIQVDDAGVTYFAFIDDNQDSVFFIKNIGVNPKMERVDSTGSLASYRNKAPLLAFALDNVSNSYIAYSTNQGLKFATNVSGIWKSSAINVSGLYPDLAIDSNGGVHLVYYDSNKLALVYGHQGPSSTTWEYSIVDGNGNVGLYPSLFVDASNIVHITYYDATNFSLKYTVGNLGGWANYFVSKLNNEVISNDMVVDSKGVVHIVYFDDSVEKMKYIKGSVRR